MSSSSSAARAARPVRVSVERVFELARHLTERDREIVQVLFEQQVLTTDQLALLFFSSRRRAQDRLLFLYRNRVVDRFYPPAPFGYGKPQAHWLLDEAGALLVAARLGVERKQLGWQRRDDWGSHPQLVHRLESNRFVTELIAATLPEPSLGVTAWWGQAEAARRLTVHKDLPVPRPDAGFQLVCLAGAIECYLEWDRGTETKAGLLEKLYAYLQVHDPMRYWQWPSLNLLFVVPGTGRLATLEAALADVRADADARRYDFFTGWGLVAATAHDLEQQGPLAPVWWPLTDTGAARRLTELRPSAPATDPAWALGRRWRKDAPGFWERLSPLHRRAAAAPAETSPESAQPCGADVPNPAGPTSDTDPADLQHPAPVARPSAPDLRPSEGSGLMPDPGKEDLSE